MINDNEPDKLDKFFKDHFASLQKFEESDSRDKEMLNTLIARIEQKKKEDEAKQRKSNEKFPFRNFVKNISFSSPKFAIPIAALLFLTIGVFVYNNIKQSSESVENISNSSIAKDDMSQKQIQEIEEKDIPQIIEEEKILDFGNISYDYSTRSLASVQENTDSINKIVINVIGEYFNNKKIQITKSDNTFMTNWLIDNSNIYKLKAVIDSKRKNINFTITKKTEAEKSNYKVISPNVIKNEIQDELMKNLNQFE